MKLIVGLGNPGKQYANTRHNIGFMFLDSFVNSLGLEFNKSKFNGQYLKTKINIFTNTTVLKIHNKTENEGFDSEFYKVEYKENSNEEIANAFAKSIIIATGRASGNFVIDTCKHFNVPITSNKVDIGVRVEMKDVIWKKFSDID